MLDAGQDSRKGAKTQKKSWKKIGGVRLWWVWLDGK
jgi:hypothetical protein